MSNADELLMSNFREIAKKKVDDKIKELNEIKEEIDGKIACPDQYVGEVSSVSGGFCGKAIIIDKDGIRFACKPECFERLSQEELQEELNERGELEALKQCIILVMESPHVDEFTEINENSEISFKAEGPANGATGRKIREYLSSVLNQIPNLEAGEIGENRWDNYGLILMNAIQYQCSLGVDTSVFRSDVFRDFWKAGGEEDFKTRLKVLVRDGDYVINACTEGKEGKGEKLRELVAAAIDEIVGVEKGVDAQIFRVNHPSSWNKKESSREITPGAHHPDDVKKNNSKPVTHKK